ncbi:hypothetical protein Rsub_05145 [Raphidocelis subcapitata]|uniref:Fibronectin type-III domain-containing protein n=1 Tax=Raphidocelis subcapitata TaxID=307507 RepID=A0A2V0NY21_9CHLO|nr:hypothetical protein Rsub_05145 [Raphidocelis subcapitata]|eukprot:GBF92531.1 hypothetical protein Rsub_05145 [Raphidocelis subcapitata]
MARSWLPLSAVAAVMLLLGCLPSGHAIGQLCNKDGKPAPPLNPRVTRNEMLAPENKWAEVTLSFDQPQVRDNSLGCATTYRVELLENGQPIVKQWVASPGPMQERIDFASKFNPGKTYTYRVSSVNGNPQPPRESDFAYTSPFTTAQPRGGNHGGGWPSGPGQQLCNKDGKPGQPGNPRVVRNEMLGPEYKWAEVTVQFDVPQAKDSSLGCATMYKVELLEANNNWVSKEFVKPDGPAAAQVNFARRLSPGKTYYYKITGVNDMVNPNRESDSAYTGRFTTAAMMGATPYGRRMAM